MPDGARHPRIEVHLCVSGGTAAIAFYQEAFGAELTEFQKTEDGLGVLHASLHMFGGDIMLHDENLELGADVLSPRRHGGTSVAITINFDAASDVDAALDRAVEAGAAVTHPARDAPWGARYARLRDPFGHIWAFSAPSASTSSRAS